MTPAPIVLEWIAGPCGAAIVLSDGRIISVRSTDVGGWVVAVEWSPAGRSVASAVDRDDAAWLATAYVLGALGGEL